MLSQVSCGQQDSRVLGRSRGGRTGVWPGPSRGLPGAQGPGCGKERREEPGPGRARGRPSHWRARSLLPVSTRGGSGGGRPGPEPAASPAAGCGTDMHAGAGSTRAAARPPGRAKGGEPCSPVSPPDPSRRALPLGSVTPHARQGREVSTRACLSPRGRPGRQLSRPTTNTALRVRPHPDRHRHRAGAESAVPAGCRRPTQGLGAVVHTARHPPRPPFPLRLEQASDCSLFSPRCRTCQWHPHSCTELAIPTSRARRLPARPTPEPAARLTHSPDATRSLQAVAAPGPHPPHDDPARLRGFATRAASCPSQASPPPPQDKAVCSWRAQEVTGRRCDPTAGTWRPRPLCLPSAQLASRRGPSQAGPQLLLLELLPGPRLHRDP